MEIAPAQVFGALGPDLSHGKATWVRTERRGAKSPSSGSGEREVQVSATAEVSAPPDRARVCVLVGSRKEAAVQAKSSVIRRLDYIVQSVRGHGVQEDNITVTKDFRRIESGYQMEAEVSVIFSDFGKMEDLCNLLAEKLDNSVIVSSPQFFHTPEVVENIRRQACLQAVANSRRKAFEVCRLLGQSLGRPLIVREEETKESEGGASEPLTPDNTRPLTMQQQINNASVTVYSKVFVTFELKSKDNCKRNN
ncbi:interleukin-1 receptor-associated kinase 1-binding protein 1 homolog [Hemitrygon akajei]|uniref:interleukin-1 receptor-associated kinase 1-binding protein 1 homolog n=1 Tax=Hemitrygon akajei TaxID=2704970 RepID=UPI003BF95D8E